ncbi:MAG: amidohydrolase family protein [Lacunisphaera sp.]|nr:amidohydrolase family protein [Lacunisphaera sp.]
MIAPPAELSVLAPALTPRAGEPVWLRVGRLFTGRDTTVLRDAHLVYDGARIRHAGGVSPAAAILRPGQIEPDLVLPEFTALPGLTDAHTHLFLEGGELEPAKRAVYLQLPADELQNRAAARLARLVALGVTAVREAGDRHGVGLGLQARYRSRAPGLMPYVDAPGAAINHQGRYGSFMSRPMEEQGTPAGAVDERIAAGAHRIKLIATGIINFEKGAVTAAPQMPAPELAEFAAAARARGRQTMVHCSGRDGVANCLAAGVDSVEHGYFVDDEQLAQMRDRGTAWVPTLAPVQFQVDAAGALGWSDLIRSNLQRILDGHARSLVRAVGLGVCVVAGSDAGSHGVPHGWGLVTELELMQRAGLTVAQVLRSATGAGAERLGYAGDFGRLTAGAAARFLLTPHDVLGSVANLRRPKAVIFDGQVLTTGDDPAVPGL